MSFLCYGSPWLLVDSLWTESISINHHRYPLGQIKPKHSDHIKDRIPLSTIITKCNIKLTANCFWVGLPSNSVWIKMLRFNIRKETCTESCASMLLQWVRGLRLACWEVCVSHQSLPTLQSLAYEKWGQDSLIVCIMKPLFSVGLHLLKCPRLTFERNKLVRIGQIRLLIFNQASYMGHH